MELTAAASWLNTFFFEYDLAILSLMHRLAVSLGFLLTPLTKLITLVGEKGIMFFLAAVILMLYPKTRKVGVCMFGAVACGALITNIVLKDLVARPRPFESFDLYSSFWVFVGSPAEDGFSFPSGHVTAAAAGMVSLCLSRGKKWLTPSVAWILLMAFSRNYLMAHYPSDVLFAAIIGTASAFIAWGITKLIFYFLEKYDKVFLCAFCLDFDIRELRNALYKGKH